MFLTMNKASAVIRNAIANPFKLYRFSNLSLKSKPVIPTGIVLITTNQQYLNLFLFSLLLSLLNM